MDIDLDVSIAKNVLPSKDTKPFTCTVSLKDSRTNAVICFGADIPTLCSETVRVFMESNEKLFSKLKPKR